MPFSAAIGATDAACAGLNVVRPIDTIAATIHRILIPGFCKGGSLGRPAIPAHVVVRKQSLAGRRRVHHRPANSTRASAGAAFAPYFVSFGNSPGDTQKP